MKRFSPRRRKQINLAFITLLLVLIPLAVWTFLTPSRSDAAWWNENFLYRQVADIANSNSIQLNDFQVALTVDTSALITAGKMQSNCNDIRITDQNGNLLPYWIEEGSADCNTSTTKIWTKVPEIATSGASLFFYYGNQQAQSEESGDQTFEFFDDFNTGTTLNSEKWTVSAGTWSVANGQATVSVGSGNDKPQIAYTPNYTFSDGVIESRMSQAGGHWFGIFYRTSLNPTQEGNYYMSVLSASSQHYFGRRTGGSYVAICGWGCGTSFPISSSTWYNLKVAAGGTSHTITIDDTLINSDTDATYSSGSIAIGKSASSGSSSSYEWIFTRKYAATDPTVTMGSEESSPSPVAYWAFDEGVGNVASSSASPSLPMLLTNNPTWLPSSQCISVNCVQFNGTSNYSSANSTIQWGSGDFSVGMWVKPSSTTTLRSIMSADASTATNGQVAWGFDWNADQSFQFFGRDSSGTIKTVVSSVITPGQWYYLTGIRQSGTVYFYLNGKLVGSTSGANINLNKNMILHIAKSVSGSRDYFSGSVDEVKIYPFALSSDQVKANYNSQGGLNGSGAVLGAYDNENLSDGLVGYWKMDEASWNGTSGEVIDSSGNSNNGTTANGTIASPSAKFGNAAAFDGIDDQINVNSATSLNFTASGQYAVAFWMKPNSIPSGTNGTSLFRKSNSGNGMSVYMNNNGYVVAVYNGSSNCNNGNCNNQTNVAVPTDAWTHIAVTYNNGESKMYMNGVLKSTLQIIGPLDNTSSNVNLSNGNSSCTGFTSCAYPGNFDDFRIYNRALDPLEIKQLYNFAPGPVGYWNFEEGQGSAVNDTSTYGNNGTWSGTGNKWGLGKYGKGGSFNGSSNFVNLGNVFNFSADAGFTMSAWVKTSLNEFQVILDKRNTATTWYRFGQTTDGTLTFELANNYPTQYKTVTSSKAIGDGKWHYVTVTRDNSGNILLYVDGSQVGSSTGGNYDLTNSFNTYIGASAASVAGTAFDGNIDEVRVFNYAQTPAQIIQTMNAGLPAGGSSGRDTLGYWKFDEGYGTTTNNSGVSGITQYGTLSNATWTNNGKAGKALRFNGSNSYVNMGTGMDLSAGPLTISAWIYKTANTTWTSIFDRYSSETLDCVSFGFDNTNGKKLTFMWNNPAPWNNKITANSDIPLNQWVHVAVVSDGSTATFYVNGKPDGSGSVGAPCATGTNYVGVNFAGGDEYFSGTIDELKVYNYALTSQDILADYNQGSGIVLGSFGMSADGVASSAAGAVYCVPGDTSQECAPVGEWNFDNRGAASVADTSGNGNSGTWSGTGSRYAPGKVGTAGDFNGTNDYVSTATPATTTTGDFSFSFWAKLRGSTGANQGIIYNGVSGSNGYGLYLDNANGLNMRLEFPTVNTYSLSTSLPLNEWAYVSVTKSGTTVTSYLNGRKVTSVTVGTPSTPATSTYIGSGTTSAIRFNGLLDQVRVYNYARTPAQIAWEYSNGKPVGWWKMDECQGPTAHDASGFGNDGTIQIGPSGTQTTVGTCQESNSAAAWWNGRVGKYNYSLNFDGSNDYVTAPDSASLSLSAGPYSLSAWVKGGSMSSTQTIIRKANTDYVLAVVSSRVYCEHEGTSVSTGVTLSNGVWYLLGCTYDGTTLKSYVNGQEQGSVAASPGSDGNGLLYIGSSVANQRFLGQIDEVQIFNYPLTPVQIRNVYNQGSAVRFGPLTGTP